MRAYPAFRSSFQQANGAPPRSGIAAMTFWRQFVADASDTYRSMWVAGELDDADRFIEAVLNDPEVPMVRREALWHFAEDVSQDVVEWPGAPVPAPTTPKPPPRTGRQF